MLSPSRSKLFPLTNAFDPLYPLRIFGINDSNFEASFDFYIHMHIYMRVCIILFAVKFHEIEIQFSSTGEGKNHFSQTSTDLHNNGATHGRGVRIDDSDDCSDSRSVAILSQR